MGWGFGGAGDGIMWGRWTRGGGGRGWTNGRMDGGMIECTNVGIGEGREAGREGCADGRMNGRRRGRREARVHERTNARTDEYANERKHRATPCARVFRPFRAGRLDG